MRPASAERVGFDDRLVTAYRGSNGVDAPHEERSLRRDPVVMACARLPSAMSDSSVVIDARAGDDLSAIGGEWELDPSHSALEFVARYAMFTLVRGRFTSFSGEIGIDPTHPGATSIAVDIDASSIDSAMPMRATSTSLGRISSMRSTTRRSRSGPVARRCLQRGATRSGGN
jgi:hypothetical protein